MKNGDYICSLDNDRLCRFLWTYSINHLASFFEAGGKELEDFQIDGQISMFQ